MKGESKMKNREFVARLKEAAAKETVYMWGTFGNRLTESLIAQKVKQYPKNYSAARQKFLRSKTGSEVWAFDCVGLLKGILWGWTGDPNQAFGGGVYQANGVPDTTASGMFSSCVDVSEDFSALVPGEFLSMPGHIGVYLGDGQAIEATLGGGDDGVVIRPVAGRGWKAHGKSAYIEYEAEDAKKYYIHVQSVGLRVRRELKFSGGKPVGKEIAFCPVGGDMELLEFLPGIQPDGYQWVRSRYGGVEGYSQYDSMCYYVYTKGE